MEQAQRPESKNIDGTGPSGATGSHPPGAASESVTGESGAMDWTEDHRVHRAPIFPLRRKRSTLSLTQSRSAPSACVVQSVNRNMASVSPAMIWTRLGIGSAAMATCVFESAADEILMPLG